MIIRYLTQDDVAEHDKVTSQAFTYSCSVGDPASVLPSQKVLGAFDDDNKTLFADLEIHERKCHYDGGLLTCAAVGGVAAKPEHRGKGAVKALFQHLFAQSDHDISILYPFSEAYYRQFGYERAGRSFYAAIPFTELAGIRRNHDVRLYEGNDTEQLLDLYNRCAGEYDLSFVREDAQAFSDKPYLSQSYTYIWRNNAFATFCIDRANSVVRVKEIYFDSDESFFGIIGFLRNFESNQKTVCFEKIPENSPLFYCIRELHNCEIQLKSTGSARVMNVENVLKAHRYPHVPCEFTLQVDNERFKVSVSSSGARVAKDNTLLPDVIMDVNTASIVLLRGLSTVVYLPDIRIMNAKSDFFTAFPPKETFFSDNF